MDCLRTAQLAFGLGRFFGQDMALERRTTLDGSTRTHAKTLLRAALGFHFWHDNHCPWGQLHLYVITGGSISLRLDACFHLVKRRNRVRCFRDTPKSEHRKFNITTASDFTLIDSVALLAQPIRCNERPEVALRSKCACMYDYHRKRHCRLRSSRPSNFTSSSLAPAP